MTTRHFVNAALYEHIYGRGIRFLRLYFKRYYVTRYETIAPKKLDRDGHPSLFCPNVIYDGKKFCDCDA